MRPRPTRNQRARLRTDLTTAQGALKAARTTSLLVTYNAIQQRKLLTVIGRVDNLLMELDR